MEAGSYGRQSYGSRASRRLTETKQAFKTTEFAAYVVILIALLIAGIVSDGGDAGTATDDGFGAQDVWLYATLLTIGYMISRGLAKAGSYDPYTDEQHSGSGEGLGERVRAAAQVMKEGPDAVHGTSEHQTETQTRRL